MTNNQPIHPTLLHFPQWQGSGLTNEVQIGAQTLRDYFRETTALSIQLSGEPLMSLHNMRFSYEKVKKRRRGIISLGITLLDKVERL